MDPENAEEITAARQFVVDRGLEHVKVGVFDIDGILRGKYLSRDKFPGSPETEPRGCDVTLRRNALGTQAKSGAMTCAPVRGRPSSHD